MALAFPNSPSEGAQYSSGGVTWQWDGTTWNIVISGGGGGASGMHVVCYYISCRTRQCFSR